MRFGATFPRARRRCRDGKSGVADKVSQASPNSSKFTGFLKLLKPPAFRKVLFYLCLTPRDPFLGRLELVPPMVRDATAHKAMPKTRGPIHRRGGFDWVVDRMIGTPNALRQSGVPGNPRDPIQPARLEADELASAIVSISESIGVHWRDGRILEHAERGPARAGFYRTLGVRGYAALSPVADAFGHAACDDPDYEFYVDPLDNIPSINVARFSWIDSWASVSGREGEAASDRRFGSLRRLLAPGGFLLTRGAATRGSHGVRSDPVARLRRVGFNIRELQRLSDGSLALVATRTD